MKFLVSGSLQRNTNLRRILLYVLALFICFDLLHAFSFFIQSDQLSNLLDSNIESSITSTQEIDSSEVVQVPTQLSKIVFKLEQSTLENLHMDIFLFAIQYVFCVSLALQIQVSSKFRQILLHTPPLTLLCWALVRFSFQGSNITSIYVVLGITSVIFYGCILSFTLWLLVRLGWYRITD